MSFFFNQPWCSRENIEIKTIAMWRSNLFKFEKILHSRTWKRKGTLDASFMCGYNFLHTPFNLIWHNQEPSLCLKVLAFPWHFRKSGYMERIKSEVNFLATFQDPVSLPNICFRFRFDFSHLLGDTIGGQRGSYLWTMCFTYGCLFLLKIIDTTFYIILIT